MDWRIITAVFSAIIGVYVTLILYYRWVSKHTSDNSIHPTKSALVYTAVCEQVQKANDTEHRHLEDCLEAEEERTGERFHELKTDMSNGFKEIKQCIRDINS